MASVWYFGFVPTYQAMYPGIEPVRASRQPQNGDSVKPRGNSQIHACLPALRLDPRDPVVVHNGHVGMAPTSREKRDRTEVHTTQAQGDNRLRRFLLYFGVKITNMWAESQ